MEIPTFLARIFVPLKKSNSEKIRTLNILFYFFLIMGALEKLLYVLDLLASFILTRFPYVCILTLLLQAGQRNIRQPETWLETVFEPTYVHAIIYFICGGGMTADATRRVAGFGAAVHTGFFAAKTLVKSRLSEWLMVGV